MLAGGVLTRYAGWEYIFFLNVPIGAVALLLARRVVPESRLETARRRYDPLGALTVTGGLLLLVYTISQAPSRLGDRPARSRCSRSRRVAAVAFIVIETRVEAPLDAASDLPAADARGGERGRASCSAASFFAFIFVATLYMQQVLGTRAIQTGLAWLATSLTSVAFAGVSQALVTRRSPKLVHGGRDGV